MAGQGFAMFGWSWTKVSVLGSQVFEGSSFVSFSKWVQFSSRQDRKGTCNKAIYFYVLQQHVSVQLSPLSCSE